MDMAIIEDDNDNESILESMPVGCIDINSTENQAEDLQKWYPDWQNPEALAPEQIGNCYEMTAEYVLTIRQPYPGDDLAAEDPEFDYCSPQNRF